MKTKSSEKCPDYLTKMARLRGVPGCKYTRKKARMILRGDFVPEEPQDLPGEKRGLKQLLGELNKNQEETADV